MRKSAINVFEIDNWRKENETTNLVLRNTYHTKNRFLNTAYHLRVSVNKDQSWYKQESANRADFHTDSHGAAFFRGLFYKLDQPGRFWEKNIFITPPLHREYQLRLLAIKSQFWTWKITICTSVPRFYPVLRWLKFLLSFIVWDFTKSREWIGRSLIRKLKSSLECSISTFDQLESSACSQKSPSLPLHSHEVFASFCIRSPPAVVSSWSTANFNNNKVHPYFQKILISNHILASFT